MKNKRLIYILQSTLGILLLLLAIFVFTSTSTKMLSGLCIGFGSALLVLGIGNLIRSFIVSKIEDEEIKRNKAIEVNDERNIRIKEKSSCMVAKIINYLLMILILILSFLGVDKIIILLLASILIIEFILLIIFSNYYAKRM